MQIRKFPEHNYMAMFSEGKTIRLRLDPSKPISELNKPEFYDIKLTSLCTGNCPYCYQNSGEEELGYEHALVKLDDFFGNMNPNDRPFQVAYGGGNPNQHKDFPRILAMTNFYRITPNYTTNGIGLTDEVLDATEKYCKGVAISCHPHLEKNWTRAIHTIGTTGVQTNVHLIISDAQSIIYAMNVYREFKDKVKYFVLLPYIATGRADKIDIDYEYLTDSLSGLPNLEQIAFGANFYTYLCQSSFSPSLYEPEIFSKYLDVKDMKLYKSSFNLEVC